MIPLSIRQLDDVRIRRGLIPYNEPIVEPGQPEPPWPGALIVIGGGQVLGGGLLSDWSANVVTARECWSVSDLKQPHWHPLLGQATEVVFVTPGAMGAMKGTLLRFTAQTELIVRSLQDRKEGVLDAMRAWAQEGPTATVKAAQLLGGHK